jgi:hypothetical protein
MNFIKLTNRIINIAKINQIIIKKNKFNIYLNNGNNIFGIILYGSGCVYSNEEEIKICEKENSEDYKIMQNWIKKIDNN